MLSTERLLVALVLIVGLSACSERSRLVSKALEAGIIQERYVDYWILKQYSDGIYCGKWDKNNKQKKWREGYRYFAVVEGVVDTNPSRDVWQIFCSDDPISGIKKRFGIGPIGPEEGHVHLVYRELESITELLNAYKADQEHFPYSEDGLSPLLPTVDPGAKNPEARHKGYLQEIPLDPWGRPYYYQFSELGGMVATRYRLYTLGADGKLGGSGEDADIREIHMRYLKHALNISSQGF